MLGIAANFAAFLLEVPVNGVYSSHEIGPVLSFGAALAGRTLGSLILGRRASAADRAHAADRLAGGRPAGSGARRVLLPAFAVVLACYAVTLGIATAHRNTPPRNVGLTAWLGSEEDRRRILR